MHVLSLHNAAEQNGMMPSYFTQNYFTTRIKCRTQIVKTCNNSNEANCGTFLPRNESSFPGTFVPVSESNIELSFHNIDYYYVLFKSHT